MDVLKIYLTDEERKALVNDTAEILLKKNLLKHTMQVISKLLGSGSQGLN